MDSIQPRSGTKRSLPRDVWGRIDRPFSQTGGQEGSRYVVIFESSLWCIVQEVELTCLVVFGPGLGVHVWGDETGVVIAIRTFNGHDLFSCVAGDAGATGKWINLLSVVSPAHSTLCTETHRTAFSTTPYYHARMHSPPIRCSILRSLSGPIPPGRLPPLSSSSINIIHIIHIIKHHRSYNQALTTGSGRVGKRNWSGRRGRAVSWSDECESLPFPPPEPGTFRVSRHTIALQSSYNGN